MELITKLKKTADELGVDFFGIANLSPVQGMVAKLWDKEAARFPRAVSFGIALPYDIVNQQPNRFSSNAALNYRHHAYNVINQRLDHIASRLSSVIQKAGSRSLPIPTTQELVYNEDLYGIFSHKMAARFAGLGWIGKCCLLVTPSAGPRVRWGSVLTDAPLKAAEKPLKDGCGDCHECVDICPTKAFTGKPFREADPREARYNAHKCSKYLSELEKTSALGVCGMCLYVCPYGRDKIGNAEESH